MIGGRPLVQLLAAALVAVVWTACAGAGGGPRKAGSASAVELAASPSQADRVARQAPAPTPEPAPGMVAVRLGDGPISRPMQNPALQPCVLRAQFPAGLAGQRTEVVLLRSHGQVQRQEWMRMTITLRADAQLRIAGLPAGRYEVQAVISGAQWCSRAHITADLPSIDVGMVEAPPATASQ